jgi:hypothetical protein
LPTTGRFDENPGKTPQKTQEGLEDKMGGIDKEETSLTLLGFLEKRFKFFLEILLGLAG